MIFTAGILLVFLNIFLSGLIFLRFYFIGEFSKQFNTKIPMVRLGFYSLIPGLVIFFFGIVCYRFFDSNFSFSGAIEIYADLLNSKGEFSKPTTNFLDNEVVKFISFNFCTYFFAGFFGFLFHYIIQKYDLDKKVKLLRFRNYWFYVFSGEILKFKKFIKASADLDVNNVKGLKDTVITYADILCSINGHRKLYTGYVVDYELDSDNMHQLDKIYLLDTHYSEAPSNSGLINNPSNIRKKINGDLFVVDYKHVLNINLTYVPSLKRFKILDKAKTKRIIRWLFAVDILKTLLLLLWIFLIWFAWLFTQELIAFLPYISI